MNIHERGRTIFAVTKLLYACSAWWGYATTDDENHIKAVSCHAVSLYSAQSPAAAAQLVNNYDDALFTHIISICYINFFFPKQSSS